MSNAFEFDRSGKTPIEAVVRAAGSSVKPDTCNTCYAKFGFCIWTCTVNMTAVRDLYAY